MGKAEVVAPASFFDTFLFLIDFVVKPNFHRLSELAVQIFMEKNKIAQSQYGLGKLDRQRLSFADLAGSNSSLKNFSELISGRVLKPQPIHVSSA